MTLNVSGRAEKVDRETRLRERHDDWHKIGLRVNSHTVVRDPEGNEFCVEPGPAGR